MNFYTMQKIKELELERLNRKKVHSLPQEPKPRRKTIFGPLAAGAGRALRRAGEGLESWGAPPQPEPDPRSRAQM